MQLPTPLYKNSDKLMFSENLLDKNFRNDLTFLNELFQIKRSVRKLSLELFKIQYLRFTLFERRTKLELCLKFLLTFKDRHFYIENKRIHCVLLWLCALPFDKFFYCKFSRCCAGQTPLLFDDNGGEGLIDKSPLKCMSFTQKNGVTRVRPTRLLPSLPNNQWRTVIITFLRGCPVET